MGSKLKMQGSANLGHSGWKSEERSTKFRIPLPNREASELLHGEEGRKLEMEFLHLLRLFHQIQLETRPGRE